MNLLSELERAMCTALHPNKSLSKRGVERLKVIEQEALMRGDREIQRIACYATAMMRCRDVNQDES
jgi:hypothetical protein